MAVTPGVRLPGVLPLQLGACLRRYGKTHRRECLVRTTTTSNTTTTSTTRCLSSNAFLLCVTVQARPWRATWLMLLALDPPRRRERRLRSWLRHERMTVAAELSAALHHSRDGRQVSRVGLRAQKTDSSWDGRRQGVPEDPGPPQLGVERVACPRSTGLPPLPDLCGGEVHDATLVKFLLRQTLLQRKKEEEERKKEEDEEKEEFLEQSMQELRLLSKTPLAGRSLQQTNRMMELLKLRDAASSSSSKRKRKKRERKRFLGVSPLVAAPDVDNGSVFFLVSLCSLRLTTCSRCLTT